MTVSKDIDFVSTRIFVPAYQKSVKPPEKSVVAVAFACLMLVRLSTAVSKFRRTAHEAIEKFVPCVKHDIFKSCSEYAAYYTTKSWCY